LRPQMRTSFHHQPEAQHPKSPAIETPAGRLPHLCANNDRFAPQKSSELFTLGFPASCHSVMSDAANNGQC